MQDEIKRITHGTDGTDGAGKFNGNTIFNNAGIKQQVGADGGQEFTGSALDLTTGNTDAVGSSQWGQIIDSSLANAGAGLVSISSQTEATLAVGEVSAGVDYVSSKRADIGAEIKRMEHTLDGLRTYEENIGATESRIRDVDVARETSEMSKYSILQQVGTAMLAQANQMPQGVLQLLG